jgi:hypothetical protein
MPAGQTAATLPRKRNNNFKPDKNMKAHHVICLALFSVMSATAQEEESMIGKKYTVAEDLGMFHFFSAVVGNSYLLESFSTSDSKFDAKHIRVFLVESKGGMEERTIVDELLIDRDTDDSFSYVPIYDRRSDSKREYFARFAFDNGLIILKELYEFDPDSKKIITRQPIPGMQVELDEY